MWIGNKNIFFILFYFLPFFISIIGSHANAESPHKIDSTYTGSHPSAVKSDSVFPAITDSLNYRGLIPIHRPISSSLARGLDIILWPLRETTSGLLWGVGKISASAGNPNTIRLVKEIMYFYKRQAGWYPVFSYTSGYRPLAGAALFYKVPMFKTTVTSVWGGKDLFSNKLKISKSGSLFGFSNAIYLKGIFRQDDNIEFYGIGPTPHKQGGRSLRRDGATSEYGVFTLATSQIALGLWQKTIGHFKIQGDGGVSYRKFRMSGDNGPNIDEVFNIPVLFNKSDLNGLRLINNHLKAEFNTLNPKNIHSHGLKISSYFGTSHGFSNTRATYISYGGLFTAHLPPILKTRSFTTGISVDAIHNLDNSNRVPITEYPKHHFFRGASHRSLIRTDNVLAEYFLEYQWAVNHLTQGQLFINGLSVGKDANNIKWNKGLYAVGAGLEFHNQANPLGRMLFVGGSEGFRFTLEFGIDKRPDKIQWLN